MRRFFKRTLRPITWTLALAFAVVLSVQCVMAAQATPSQHVCCSTAQDAECYVAVQADCCAAQKAVARLAASTLVPLAQLTAVVSLVAFIPPPPPLLTWGEVDFERSPLKLDGTATYLRISTFRI